MNTLLRPWSLPVSDWTGSDIILYGGEIVFILFAVLMGICFATSVFKDGRKQGRW